MLLVPVVLLAWGADKFVAVSDTSSGVFIKYTTVRDKYGREAVFAVKDGYPYNMVVSLEDTTDGTFHELPSPLPVNTKPSKIYSYYNFADSSTYIVMYLPDYDYSNFTIFKYNWDYSWSSADIHEIDETPDDTLVYPQFEVYANTLFLSCIKTLGSDPDTFLIYTSSDWG